MKIGLRCTHFAETSTISSDIRGYAALPESLSYTRLSNVMRPRTTIDAYTDGAPSEGVNRYDVILPIMASLLARRPVFITSGRRGTWIFLQLVRL